MAPAKVSRRSKRARVQTKTVNAQSPSQEERDDSLDDFDEYRPRANKRNRPTTEEASASAGTNHTLIEVIKGNGKHIPQVVKIWVEKYEKDPKPAMVELLMMLFEACGAKYRIQGEFLDETDVDDVVVDLVKLARDVSSMVYNYLFCLYTWLIYFYPITIFLNE